MPLTHAGIMDVRWRCLRHLKHVYASGCGWFSNRKGCSLSRGAGCTHTLRFWIAGCELVDFATRQCLTFLSASLCGPLRLCGLSVLRFSYRRVAEVRGECWTKQDIYQKQNVLDKNQARGLLSSTVNALSFCFTGNLELRRIKTRSPKQPNLTRVV